MFSSGFNKPQPSLFNNQGNTNTGWGANQTNQASGFGTNPMQQPQQPAANQWGGSTWGAAANPNPMGNPAGKPKLM
jgi:hypothetical protein